MNTHKAKHAKILYGRMKSARWRHVNTLKFIQWMCLRTFGCMSRLRVSAEISCCEPTIQHANKDIEPLFLWVQENKSRNKSNETKIGSTCRHVGSIAQVELVFQISKIFVFSVLFFPLLFFMWRGREIVVFTSLQFNRCSVRMWNKEQDFDLRFSCHQTMIRFFLLMHIFLLVFFTFIYIYIYIYIFLLLT